jgi:hypothetical protein
MHVKILQLWNIDVQYMQMYSTFTEDLRFSCAHPAARFFRVRKVKKERKK